MEQTDLITKLSQTKSVIFTFNSNYLSHGFLAQEVFKEEEYGYLIDPKPLFNQSDGKLYFWIREKNLFASNGKLYVPSGEKIILNRGEHLMIFNPFFEDYILDKLTQDNLEKIGIQYSLFKKEQSRTLVDELNPNFAIFAMSLKLD